MKKFSFFVILVIIFLSITGQGFTQENSKISAYMFGDYYYVLKNHNEDIEGENGFWFRRIYLTYDKKLDDAFNVRLRFEMNSKGDFETADYLNTVVKDAYLQYKKGNNSILFGISSTPTLGLIEKIWGYRSVEKTPMDLYKYSSSRDFGLAFKGSLDADKKVRYHLMYANGSSNKSEVGKGKKLMTALSYHFNSGLVLEGYFDIEDRTGGKKRSVIQGFLGIDRDNFKAGIQYSSQTRRIGPNTDDQKLKIMSFFGRNKLSEDTWAFYRFDMGLDPNPDGEKMSYLPLDKTAKFNLIIAGLDIKAGKDVHIMPNFEAVFYQENDNGIKPGSDLIPRLTMYYKF